MSKRYETIRFDDFTGGEQCDVIDPPENSFKMSNELVIENNKIKLGPNMQNGALYDMTAETDGGKISLVHQELFYVFCIHTISMECMIKRITSAGVITTIHTFAGGGNEPHQFFKFKDKVIVSMLDGAYKIQYANINMVAWTNCNTIGAGLVIRDHLIVDDRLYVLCNDAKIYYSDDGISFTLLVTLDPDYLYNTLLYLDGYFYVISHITFTGSGLVRVSLTGEIQDEIVSIGSVYSFRAFVLNGNLYVLLNYRFLYRVEGSSLIPVFEFENNVTTVYSFGFLDSVFFYDATDSALIEMNSSEKISRSFKIIAGTDYIRTIHVASSNRIYSAQADSLALKVAIYEILKYTTPGSIQTDIIRLEGGLGTPVQLVLNHKPLTTNAWVKVYIKFDNAAAWGAAVITSIDLNAVRKVYDFPVGTECSFIQAKIEYGTDDSAETPEDATLDLIYLPTGLVNAE